MRQTKKLFQFALCIVLLCLSACGDSSDSSRKTDGGATVPDTTPPTIRSMSPGDCAGINESIIVTFSEEIDPVTINSASFLVSGGATGYVTYDTTAKKAYFNPVENLTPNTRYDVTITSDIKDLAGNAMGGYYQWSFTTGFGAAEGTWQEIPSCPTIWPGLERAVWTGSEILIFGGFTRACRFNPFNRTLKDLSWANIPSSRESHTAVWTGSEMIVWGGTDQVLYLNTGARYNPVTDSWVSMTITNAPHPRMNHSAIWTGSEMIIWGGEDGLSLMNTGGRYNPSTNSWTSVSTANAPSARRKHCAVWTGSEMIIWGGEGTNSEPGGRYNPSTNTWIVMSTTGAPLIETPFDYVWTGIELIVWGRHGESKCGGRYNPSTDTWIAISTGGPGGYYPIFIWTGTEMIVWSGCGGRYNPSTDTWIAMPKNGAPPGGAYGVWTGTQMIVVGDFSDKGGIYTP